MTKDHILSEIRRTAAANDGKPLGRLRFASVTGIREHDWSGKHWARWSDALREAGFGPNQFNERLSDDDLLDRLAAEVRHFGRMPTAAELRLRRREDSTLPSHNVFARYGSKRDVALRLADYCRDRPDCADVIPLLAPLLEAPEPAAELVADDASGEVGFVYLIRSGRFYKIGLTGDVGRRRYELQIQLPEPITLVHQIATDDPAGIEAYWHKRFALRRMNGEWFELDRADVAAFKRRQFM